VVSTDAARPSPRASRALANAPTLSITAIAFDAGSVELARDTISVRWWSARGREPRPAPLAGRAISCCGCRCRAPTRSVTVASLDPASRASPRRRSHPGRRDGLRVPITGVAEGATTLSRTRSAGQVAIAVASRRSRRLGAALVADAARRAVRSSSRRSVSRRRSGRDEHGNARSSMRPPRRMTPIAATSSDARRGDVLTPLVVPAGSTN
jgi:hypothetical protein